MAGKTKTYLFIAESLAMSCVPGFQHWHTKELDLSQLKQPAISKVVLIPFYEMRGSIV